jgi:hypothetical protein
MKKSNFLFSNIKNISSKYLFIFSLFFILSFVFFQYTFWYQDQSFFIKSKLWSDFAAHLPMIRSFSLGDNLPPEYPMFGGEKMNYHFLFYLIVGLLEKVGFRIDLAFNVLSSLGAALLMMMIVRLGEYFFSFRAGLLALALFLFNGSLTFLDFFKKFSPANLSDLIKKVVTQKQFINFGPWDGSTISAFWNLNIFTNQRHLALGLGVLFYLIYFFENKFKDKKIEFSNKEKILLFLVIILLPLLHQGSFAFLGIYLVVSFLLNLKEFSVKTFIFLSILGIFSSAIYLYWGSSFAPHYYLGFLAQDKTFLGLLNYWVFNFGLYTFFIPLILFFVLFKKKKFEKLRGLYLTGFIVFVLAHLIKFSPDIINNHKFITIFLVILNIIVAGLLDKLFSSKIIWKNIGAIIVLFILTFSGLIDLFPILNDSLVVKKDYQQTEFGQWAVNSKKDGVFLVNSYLYNPASLAGRKLYLDYGYFAWSMGYPDKERRAKQDLIFANDISKDDWCSLLSEEQVDYLALSMSEKKFLEEYNFEESSLKRFAEPNIFDAAQGKSSTWLYNVEEICQ